MNIQPHAMARRSRWSKRPLIKADTKMLSRMHARLQGGSMNAESARTPAPRTSEDPRARVHKGQREVAGRTRRVGARDQDRKTAKSARSFPKRDQVRRDARVSVESFERLYGCTRLTLKRSKGSVAVGPHAEDAKAFRAEIDNLVVPLEEKSVDTLAQAVKVRTPASSSSMERRLVWSRMGVKLNQQQQMNLTPKLESPTVLPGLREQTNENE